MIFRSQNMISAIMPQLFRRKRREPVLKELKDVHGCKIFKNGRDAAYGLCKRISERNPEAGVLLPSYICRDLYMACQDGGVKVIFYDIDYKTFEPDINSVRSLSDNTVRALIYVNFFGLCNGPSEELAGFCADKSIKLWIDNAHTFGYPDIKTASGDAAIYSLRKVLPVHEIGIGMGDDILSSEDISGDSTSNGFTNDIKFLFGSLTRLFMEIPFPPALNRFLLLARKRESAVCITQNCRQGTKYGGDFSKLAGFILDRYDIQGSAARRIDNFNRLSGYLRALNISGISLPFEECPGRVPLAFPVIVPGRAEEVADGMLLRGYAAYPWPDLPSADEGICSQAAEMASSLLLLPIHPGVTDSSLRKMAKALKELTE